MEISLIIVRNTGDSPEWIRNGLSKGSRGGTENPLREIPAQPASGGGDSCRRQIPNVVTNLVLILRAGERVTRWRRGFETTRD